MCNIEVFCLLCHNSPPDAIKRMYKRLKWAAESYPFKAPSAHRLQTNHISSHIQTCLICLNVGLISCVKTRFLAPS